MIVGSFLIRPGVEEDHEHLARIFNASRASGGCFGSDSITRDEFKSLVEGETIYVAEVNHEIGGFVSVWETDRFVHHLYVDPRYQGRGIGKHLLDLCVERYELPLSLKCERANVRALSFYRRHGWEAGETGDGPDGSWQRLWLKHA